MASCLPDDDRSRDRSSLVGVERWLPEPPSIMAACCWRAMDGSAFSGHMHHRESIWAGCMPSRDLAAIGKLLATWTAIPSLLSCSALITLVNCTQRPDQMQSRTSRCSSAHLADGHVVDACRS